ncbi:Hemimethylated DNA-binding protein YccV like-domain-containing protein [Elsinoe ampelina]|uniref:Hemimethylated DNA-binding protein YccV like-domain-containing protein n=1 Tax=Elsinoe ampelina TaxID=302913 RepID=A0A6A6G3P5_9PEZI|nr:Hemimethylated DNA-binding protein YccV like-domain-containing protein [Elsinoe ampelina]
MAGDSILRLPDELLQAIFYYLSPRDAIHLGSTSRRMTKLLDQPLLWRYFCDTVFNYWHFTDDTDPAVVQRQPNAPWKRLFCDRITRDQHNSRLFESALTTQHERYLKIQKIAESGYEAREMLVDNLRCPDSAEDVLARRYYAEAAIGLINRAAALETWSRMNQDPNPSLERSIAAFDLFIIGGRWGNISEISSALDKAAEEIKADHPNILEQDPELRALVIADWLREHGIAGLDPTETAYHAMKHNFLSFTLRERSKCSLPLQSTVIFCAVATRLGLTAHCINFPGHIFAIILPPTPTTNSTTPPDLPLSHRFYISPWSHSNHQSGGIIPYPVLASQLSHSGVPPRLHTTYLSPASPADMVLRTCRNIMRSYEEWHNIPPNRDDLIGNHHAFYAYLWAMALVEEVPSPIPGGGGPGFLPVLDHPNAGQLATMLREHFPEDLELVRKYLGPLFGRSQRGRELMLALAEMKAEDLNRRPVMRRVQVDGQGSQGELREGMVAGVKFKIGQMFQHKRYGYVGVIRAWDGQCRAHENWIASMRVDDLENGRAQAFYNILGEDRSSRYVAEENIEPIYTEPGEKLLGMAGRYFKRWDADGRRFVSNVRDEYPDD